MRVACRAGKESCIVVGCLLLALGAGVAQKKPATGTSDDARRILVDKAHAVESRGRPDMAIQLWQQILLSDPNNAEALAGEARDYKLIGNTAKSDDALERLRRINPNDPNIAKIQNLSSTNVQSDQLRQAGDLARQGKNDQAMRIYRDLYGDRPPDGDIALAYYETLYGATGGKQQAIEAMRALAKRNPGDTRFAIQLGTMLTYDPHTRAEGIRILSGFPNDSNAETARRQALIWDSANPASAAELRDYLKQHPQDTEIAGHLKEDQTKLAQMHAVGPPRNPEEAAAYAALNAHKLDEAQARFTELLQKEPNNGRAAAGMGFLRMQQGNFGGAISFLTQAEQNGFKQRTVDDALATSRFWFTMGEASTAFDANQYDVAEQKYRAALAMRPKSPDALNGLAGLLIKQQQFEAAAGVYQQILKIEPKNADAWRGLFLCYARDNQNQKALALMAHFPPPVKAALAKDPDYLRTLASIYQAMDRGVDAERTLAQALALPFPDNGATLKADTRLQFAGILMQANRFDQAAELYTQVLNDDPSNIQAWMGLVSAHHNLNQDAQAIADLQKMPPATYEASLADPGFLQMLGSIYQQANQFEIAQGLLERSIKIQTAAGNQPSIALELQLAAIYMQRNNTAQAYEIYRQVIAAHPDRADAWKGLVTTLQATNRTTEAIQEIAQIPAPVRQQLEADIDFQQTEAELYASAGDNAHAIEYMNKVESHYAALKQLPPSNVEIQNAWLLYNTKNDRALYPALLRLGSRTDLTAAQRETVQTIWADWSVRRAGTAIANGNIQRGVDILSAAAAAFPDNLAVRKAVAGGYLSAGHAKESLAIFKQIPMQDATAADFQGAIGAALTANDMTQAEAWLRQALDRYPTDPAILSLAARYEQARGNDQRAADYYRASLAAMPQMSPTDKLAHELAYPDQEKGNLRATTPADLQRLLDPNYEPFPKTAKLPPLPAYGPDPYSGTAPIVIAQPLSAAPQPGAQFGVPTTTVVPLNTTPTVSSTTTTTTATTPHMHRATSRPHTTTQQGAASSTTGAKPAAGKPSAGKTTHPARSSSSSTSSSTGYSGKMNLPPSEQTIDSTEPVYPQPAPAQPPAQQPQTHDGSWTPEASNAPHSAADPAAGLRIASQPMDPGVAHIQALFAEQTDAQLTQGSANSIHAIGNAPVQVAAHPAATPAGDGHYTNVQYTPSAQEAASGAYSAPKQQGQIQPQNQSQPQQPGQIQPQQPAGQQCAVNQLQCVPATQPVKKHRRHKAAETQAQQQPAQGQTVPTLVTAPGTEQAPQQPSVTDVQPVTPPATTTTNTGLTDEQLEDRNLPPLRGPWVKVQREQRTTSPREEAEAQLQGIESGYSPWLGGAAILNYRTGALGYDHLAAFEAPIEASLPLGYNARITFIAKPVFLDSGQADGTSTINVLEATSTGTQLALTTIPQPLGTETATDTNPPPQQNAAGVGGEVQLAFPHLAIAGGYTPAGFLIGNFTARANWRPANGPITFTFNRDSITDSQLSYAGLRDPAGNTLGNAGAIWGGVIANEGQIRFSRGDAQSGYYFGAGGQYIQGTNVESNYRFDGSGGAYWRVWTAPEYGTLSIGANFFAMHYDNNQLAYTYGMGGYFSPSAYVLANVPFTWNGNYGTRWHYNVMGGFGVQGFQENKAKLFPLVGQDAEETALGSPYLPDKTSVGPNYDFRTQAAYAISPHWFAGGFFSANNARDYTGVSVGFYIRFLFRAQPSTVAGPTGLFPSQGLRPFRVP